ncbi:MAG: hypothetical protein ACREC0_11755 [Methylocella sp.]
MIRFDHLNLREQMVKCANGQIRRGIGISIDALDAYRMSCGASRRFAND